MFTGLVEKAGTIRSVAVRTGHSTLTIAHDAWESPLQPGESICVSGACLTAAAVHDGSFTCDVLDETVARTSLARKRAGDLVNLERALRADGRLGGHLVSGHVDGVGRVRRTARAGVDTLVEIECAPELLRMIVPKGSVACDGISLTVVATTREAFTVHVIPFTRAHTSVRQWDAGTLVNLEGDLIAKYVFRYLETRRADGGLSLDALRNAGLAD